VITDTDLEPKSSVLEAVTLEVVRQQQTVAWMGAEEEGEQ